MHSDQRYPPRFRRWGGILLAVAVALVAAGMGTGHGSVLAVGLLLAPFGLHLLTGGPEPRRRVVRILPNDVTDPDDPAERSGERSDEHSAEHGEWVPPPMSPRNGPTRLEAGTGPEAAPACPSWPRDGRRAVHEPSPRLGRVPVPHPPAGVGR